MSSPLNLEGNYEFGNKLFAEGKYYAATHFYQQVLEEEESHTGAIYQLGMSYEKLRDYQKASDQFKKIFDRQVKGYPLLGLHYGINAKASGNCEEAIEAFKRFLDQGATNDADKIKTAQWELESCQGSTVSPQNTDDVTTRILDPGNDNNMSEFGVAQFGENKVIYTGVSKVPKARKLNIGETKAAYDDQYLNRLFSATLDNKGVSNGALLKIKLPSGNQNIGSPFLSEDGNKLYYTMCQNGNQDCGIYYSRKKSGSKWSEPIKLNEIVNAAGSDSRHAVLGRDKANREYIFFSSNRRGGQGAFDIWYAMLDEEGIPVEAINLGPTINTSKMEVTPYFDQQSNLLFFSSNGHKGLGQLDVYMVSIDFISRQGIIYNVGAPINSRTDDYYFSMANSATTGYVSSNRVGSVAGNQHSVTDNIYQLTFNAPFTYKNLPDYISKVNSFNEDDIAFKLFSETFDYKDLALNSEDASKLSEDDINIDGSILQGDSFKADQMVYLLDENQNIIDSTSTDENGKFRFRKLPGDNKYSLLIDSADDLKANMRFLDDSGQELLAVNSKDDEEYFNYKKLQDQSVALQKMGEDQISISGNLLKDGQPAANQPVVLVDENGNVVAQGYTDSEGKFHFRNLDNTQKYALKMDDSDDLQANMRFLDDSGQELLVVNSQDNEEFFYYKKLQDQSVALQKMAEDQISISGNLLKDGQPAANQPVVLVDENGNVVAQGYTDSEGKFHFRNLDNTQKYALKMDDSDDLQANMRFLDDGGQELLAVNSKDNEEYFNYKKLRDQSVALQKMAEDQISISGNLLKDGQPAANQPVVLVDENGNVVAQGYTDSEGKFHFRNLDNTQKYALKMDDSDDLQANMQFLDDSGQELLAVNSKDNEEFFNYKKLQDQSVALQKMAEDQISISGNLLKDGQPAANQPVVLVDENGNVVAQGYTDSEGKFHFRNLDNTQKYALKMDDSDDLQANMQFLDDSGQELLAVNSKDNEEFFNYKKLQDQSVALKKMAEDQISISGNLLKDGQPAANQPVVLVDENGNVVAQGYTDSEGKFHFRNLDNTQKYALKMDDSDDLQANMRFLDDGGQELLTVNSKNNEEFFNYKNLRDQSLSTQKMTEDHINISGSLLKDGQPAGNKKVILVDANGKMIDGGYTDKDGKFNFKHLANSEKYILRMDDDESLKANMGFFDVDDNLLLSTNSEDNSIYFEYRDLSDQVIPRKQIAANNTQFKYQDETARTASASKTHIRKVSPAEQLRQMFKPTMTYEQYDDLIKEQGEKLSKDINLRVQIGAFRRPSKRLFKHLNLGEIDIIKSRGLTKFLIGNFNELEKAEALRKKAFDKGVNDAFVSVYYRGHRVALLIYNHKNKLVRKFVESND